MIMTRTVRLTSMVRGHLSGPHLSTFELTVLFFLNSFMLRKDPYALSLEKFELKFQNQEEH